MLNTNFKSMNKHTRHEKMRDIIASKANGITEEHIQEIFDNIDIERQYTITGTSNITILSRNMFNEEGDNYKVSIIPIYGDFTPGFFGQDGQMTEPEFDNAPIAFLKQTHIYEGDRDHFQQSIFIYQPHPSVAAS